MVHKFELWRWRWRWRWWNSSCLLLLLLLLCWTWRWHLVAVGVASTTTVPIAVVAATTVMPLVGLLEFWNCRRLALASFLLLRSRKRRAASVFIAAVLQAWGVVLCWSIQASSKVWSSFDHHLSLWRCRLLEIDCILLQILKYPLVTHSLTHNSSSVESRGYFTRKITVKNVFIMQLFIHFFVAHAPLNYFKYLLLQEV